jgi:P27 family predicted phage terminase small subunit
MGTSGLIAAADAHVLRLYCEAWSRYRQAAAELYGKSAPLLNGGGHLAKNPLHQVVRDNADHVRLLARELGLSPAARASLQLLPGAELPDIDAELGPPPRLRNWVRASDIGACDAGGPNRHRVAPNGSAVATPYTVWNVRRNRCHGGGPALGALNGAVIASPCPPPATRPHGTSRRGLRAFRDR